MVAGVTQSHNVMITARAVLRTLREAGLRALLPEVRALLRQYDGELAPERRSLRARALTTLRDVAFHEPPQTGRLGTITDKIRAGTAASLTDPELVALCDATGRSELGVPLRACAQRIAIWRQQAQGLLAQVSAELLQGRLPVDGTPMRATGFRVRAPARVLQQLADPRTLTLAQTVSALRLVADAALHDN